ncbi:tandem-95 repeat protein [Vibrio owensii]|uniref:tandem-95 repeat protein n=1 Tax=Vibrio owensii TaxID=696485 RepID=UPI002FEF9EE8
MDRTSLVSLGGQIVVIGLDGQLKTLAQNEQPLPGELIVARTEAEPEKLQVQVAREEGVQDVTDDVAQIIDALQDGQDPTLLNEEFAPAAGESNGSSLQASGTVERTAAELLADTVFETTGLAALGFSETQSLTLAELYLNLPNTSPAVTPIAPVAEDDNIQTDEDVSITIDVLANDDDEDSDSLTIDSATVPEEQGTVAIVDGELVFTPAEDFNGEATITYVVTDGELTDEATVSVTVNPVNDAPVANDDSTTTDEDMPVTIDVLPNDSDVDGDTLTIVNASVPAEQGTVEIVDGKLVFTPAEDFNGEATITYVVTDGELTDEATVLVTVNPVNDAPVANDDSNTTDEDTPVTIDVLPNDSDVDGDTLTIVNASVPAEQGTVEIVDGKLVFTPAENFNGDATISYTVSDGALEDEAEVSVTVNPLNDAPTTENAIPSQVLQEDFAEYTINLNDAFSDVDDADSELTFSVSGNSNIQVSIVDGIATITPTADWNGSEELTFTATDPSGLEVSQTVDFTVNAVADIVSDSANIVEDTPTILDVLDNDSFEGQSPVVSVEAGNGPTNGSVVVNNDGTITYTPNQDYNGADEFTYTVTSGGVTETTTVTLNVTPVNDKPVVENTIADQVLPEDFAEYTIDLNDAFSDVDNADSELTFSVSGNSNIQVSIVDGIATITPTADWNGSEELTFTAKDPSGLEVSQTVDFTVNAVADIVADSANIVEDTPTILDVLDNDSFEGQSPVISVEAGNGPTNGSVVVNNDGTITYTPNQDYNGADEFTYTVTSGGVTETTTVTLNVTPVNDKPVVENTIADQVLPEDFTPYTIDLNDAFSDVDNADSELTFSVSGNSNIQVSIVDGVATINPTADWNGSEELTFTATDPSGLEVSQTVDFTVNAVADIVADSADIVEDTPTVLNVLDNDSFEGQSPVVSVEAGNGPANGSVVVNNDGTITYTPDQDYNGSDEFTYTVTSGGVTETTTVSLNVTPVNDKPVVENTIADQALPEDFTPYTIDLNDAFSDVDDADSELTFAVSGNSNIQVSIVGGIATITPTADWNGSEELTFTATDPSGLEVSQTVDFTVNAVADIVADSADIVEDTPTILDVLDNDSFEGQSPVVSVEAGNGPANGSVVVNDDGTITYTPNQDYNGADEFTYTVTSGGVTETTTVTLNVTPVNDKPVVENTIADQVLPEDFAEYTINLNDAFSDVDNADSELTFTVSGNSNIQVSIVDGIATITPTADWNGSEELTFTAKDPSGLEVSQTVDFTVNAVADIVADSADIVEDTPTILNVLGNDTFEGKSPVVSVESGDGPANGNVVVNNDGTITYTPDQDYNGADEFTYTVTSGGVTETTTVTLNVTPVNDKPVVENTIADQVLPEDFAEYTINLNDAFSDVDNADSELTFSVSGNSNIQVSIVDGIATITPTADWNGSEELTFTATDPSGLEVSQTVDFTVNAVADIVADSADIVEDTPTVLNVLGNDSFEGQSPVVTVESGDGPTNGNVVVNDDGTITYTPNQDYNGTDEFTYTVTSGGVTETTTVTLNVTRVNDKPVVENTIADQVLSEDFTPYTIDLNDAFSDVDNADSELTFSVSGNSNIQVSIVDGIATITPTADWNGSEELTFTATDPSGLEVSQTVDFTVNAVADIVSDSANIVEDTPTILDVLDNDSFEGQSPVVSVEAGNGPANGSVVVNNDGTITYTPDQDYNGSDEFTYTVTSGGVTETTTVSLNVTPVNDKPVVENTIADQVLPEDFAAYTINLNDAFSDVDDADSDLTFTVSGNSNIQVAIVDGIATITPTADWNGSEELTFTATDPSGLEVSQTVDFTVNAVADIVADSADIVEDTPTILDVLDNDSFEGQSPVVSVEAGNGPTNGSVVVNNNGTITYTPDQDYNGSDEFTYTVTSGGVTETTTVTLNVTPVNDKPVVENTIAAQVLPEDFAEYTINLNDAFSDVDDADSELTFSVSGNSNIQVSIVDGIATITPTADWNGSEELTFTATDPSGLEVSQTVNFTVNAVADIVADSADIVEDTPTILDVLDNDSFEGQSPVVSVEAGNGPTNGSVVVNNDGTITYTPNQDYNGADEFTYTVTSGGVTETTTVSLNVTPVNDKPVVENTIADQVLPEDFAEYTINLNDAFSDVDNADSELTFTVSGNSNIQVSIVDGIATITPTADWNGSEELTFTATDLSGLEVSQKVDFTVNAVADIVADSADIVEDTPTILDVLDNDSFEGQSPVVSVEESNGPANGSVVVNDDGTITYTPDQDYNGADEFTYTVTSGGVTETTTVTLNVTPVNDKPVVENTIADQVLPEDFAQYTINLNDAFSDVDDADSELTFSVSGNSNIQVSIVDGIATITPTADWNGSEELTFTATDQSGLAVSQAVDFTVNAVADIVADSADIVEDTPTILDVLDNDNFEGQSPVVSVEAGNGPANGSVVVNNDGTITYTPDQDYNGADEFTYTVTSGGVTETTTVTLNVTPVNDKPLNEDFDHSADELITNVIFDTDDKPLDQGSESDHISDVEDDLNGDDLQIRITELPTSGTLYFEDENGDLQEITSADGSLYNKDSIYYEADNVGFLLGIKDRPNSPNGEESTTDFYNWGLSADGGESHSRTEYLVNGASIDISSDSGVLAQYNREVSHIGHGIADNDGQGIQRGETISIDLSENPVGSVNLGLDGLGGLFEHGDNNAALITVTYLDANATEQTQVIEFLKPEGNNMLFQETSIGFGKDYPLPEGAVITQLDFSTKTSGNWELRYVEGFPPEDSFDYVVVDSGNAESDPATVTIANQVLDGNVSENGPDLSLTGNTVTEGEDVTFSVVLDEATETAVKYPITTLASGSSADDSDVNLSNATYTNGVVFAGGYLIVPAGVSSFEIIVPTIDDLVVENDETMEVEIGSESGSSTILDNDSTSLSVSNAGDVSEGSDAVFTVSLSNEVQSPVVVNLSPKTDGNYTAEDEDLGNMTVTYIDGEGQEQTLDVSPSGDVTIPAGVTDITVTITTTQDDVYEGAESFGLVVTESSGITSNGVASGEAVIKDDGSAVGPTTPDNDKPLLSISGGGDINEGEEALFVVSLSNQTESPVVINLATSTSGAYTAENSDIKDFVVTYKDSEGETKSLAVSDNGDVTIPAGITAIEVSVPTTQDDVYEGSESFGLVATESAGITSNGSAVGQANIKDDGSVVGPTTPDNDKPALTVDGGGNVNEGENAVFTVSLSNQTESAVVVNLSVETDENYSAQDNDLGDLVVTYVDTNGQTQSLNVDGNGNVTIPAGIQDITVIVPTNEDHIYEGNETFGLTVTESNGVTTNGQATGQATVLDAESAPKVSIVADQDSVNEGQTAGFTVSLDQVADEKVTVEFEYSGTAQDGTDFTGVASIEVPAGQASVDLDITTLTDGTYEGAESFTVTIKDVEGADATASTNNSASVTINDAQQAPKVSIVADTGSTAEGSDANFTVSIDQKADEDVVVTFTIGGDVNSDDYTAPNTYTVTIPAGQTSVDLDIETLDDGIYEGAENLTVTLTGTSGADSSLNTASKEASVSVTDAQAAPKVSIVADAGSTAEGGDANFTVSIDQKADEDVVVTFTIGGDVDSDDYTAPNTYTVTIPAGQTSVALDIETLDDGIYEGAEDLTVTLTGTSGAGSSLNTASKEASVSVTDAQTAPKVSIVAGQDSVNEGQTAGFTVSLDQIADEKVTVEFEYSGTAQDGTDFTGVASIEVPAGQASVDLDIVTLTDGTYEGAESFTVTIKDVEGADATSSTNNSASVTINDAQQAPKVSIVADAGSTAEGGDANFTVSIDQKADEDVVVTFTIGGDVDSDDYTAPNTYTVTIPAGQTSVALDIKTLDDGIYEGAEDLTVTLTETSGADSSLNTASKEASVSVTDAQTAPKVSIVADQDSVNEGQTAGFTVSLDQVADEKVTVEFEYSGTAQDGTDFTGVASIEVPAGQSSVDLDITTLTDGTYEGAESFTVTIKDVEGADATASTNNSASVTINDAQQAPKVSIVADTGSNAEGSDANFTVSIDQKADEDVVVTFTIGGDVDSDDYTAPNTYTVTIPAGQTSVDLDIETLDDGIYEGTENLTVTLTGTSGADSSLNTASKEASVSVTDEQTAPKVSIAADQDSVNEGQTAGFTVSLDQIADEKVTVEFEYSGTAQDGTDFTGVASIEVPAGQSSVDLDITTLTDGTYEGAESFTVTIKDVEGAEATASTNNSASVTINDAQQAPKVSIVADTGSTAEGSDASFTVSIDQKADEDVVVTFTIGGDVDSDDYTAPNTYTVTIPAGQTSVDLDIETLDDGIYEGTEDLTVTLTGTSGADSSLNTASKEASVSIADAQHAPEFISDGDLPGDAANNDVYDFGTVNENSVSGTVVGTLVAEDLDNDELTYSFADGTTTNGLFDIDPSTGEVSLNKTIDDVDLGDYTLQVKVADGTGGVDTAEVNVSLVNVNDAPEASPSSVTTLEDSQVTLDWASFGVTDVDSETSTLSVQITSLPSDGALEYKDEQGNWQAVQTDQVLSKSQFDADGVRFTPEVNESGDDSFTGNGVGNQEENYAQIGFKPTDGEDTGQESVLTIDVTPDADAPNLVTVTPGLSLPQQDFNVTSWTNVIVGSDNGQGVAGQVLIDAIEALDLEDGSQSTTTNVQDIASGATAADEAVLVTALVYLEAGTSYDFTGRADDSLAIKIGGTLVDEARWGNGRGDIKGDAFVPTSSGFYPIEIYHHNQSGPGNFNVDVSINGQTPVDLSNSNLYVVSDSTALDAVDVRTSELKEVDGVQFYETYEVNEGLQDTAIPISEIRASLTDTDGSESLAVTLKGVPIGAVLSDGVNSITVATVNEALDVTGWSLDSLTVTPPAGSHDDFTIAVTATSTESSNGDTEDSHATINVVVHENLATNTTRDVGITNEDASLQGNVLLNDTDGDNVLLIDHITVNNTDYAVGETVSLDSGSLVVNQDGSYKFEPVEHWSGDVPSITYITNTGATETLDIEVVAVADAPKVTISVGELSKTDAVDSNHASVSDVTENTSAQNDVIASGLGLDSVYQEDNPSANVSLGNNNDTSDTDSLFVGTDYNDTFYGGGGDDVFVGGGQNDSFYGDDASTNTEHDGTDTVYLTGNFSDYEFTFKNNHGGDVPYWIFLDKRSIDSVNDNTGQEDRGDHLYEIERVVFADKVVELNPDGTYQVLQDRWIPVDVDVDLVDTDGSEMVGQTVLVDGLPDGVELHVNGQVVAQEVSGGYLIDTDAQGQASFEIKVPFDYDGSLDFPISVTATAIESSNDDSASTTESADLSARDFELESGSHGDDTISGSADHDLIVGDVQGLEIIAGQDYNIAFVLDTSGSMGSWVGNAKDEILDVFDELLDSVNQGVEPGTVNIMLSEFATGATKVIEVDLSSVTARTDFVEELNKIGDYGSGNTNYESGLQSAVDWFGSQPNVNGENITYFITDGQPNTYDKLDNIKRPEFSKVILDVGGDGQLVTLQDVVNDNNYSYGQTVSYKGNVLINSDGHIFSPLTGQKIGDIDRKNGILEYDDKGGSSVQAQHMYQVLALLSSVEAIGLGSGVSESTLQQYDTDGVVESEIDVTKLAETILGQDVPLKQGADTIHGGDGDDILLGDLIEFGGNEQGISAIQSHVAQETGQDISTVDAEAIHDYVKDNIDEFNQSHQGDKADTLYGQQGDDILFGHGGNDILVGGSGDDILIGGSGEDTFKFIDDGSGIRDGEIDTIKDFTKGEDKIDISDLLHTDDSDSIDSLLANNEIGLEADGDNLILTISESDGSASQKVVIEGGSSQYSEFLSDGSLSSADGSAILNDLLKINNDMS